MTVISGEKCLLAKMLHWWIETLNHNWSWCVYNFFSKSSFLSEFWFIIRLDHHCEPPMSDEGCPGILLISIIHLHIWYCDYDDNFQQQWYPLFICIFQYCDCDDNFKSDIHYSPANLSALSISVRCFVPKSGFVLHGFHCH